MINSLAPFTLGPAESVGPRWERWVARFENYLLAANVTAEARKKAQLLHLAGEDVFEVYLSFGSPSNLTFQETKARLTAHFLPKRNKEYKVFKFRSSRQSSSETVDDFVMRLRQLAKHCEFADVDGGDQDTSRPDVRLGENSRKGVQGGVDQLVRPAGLCAFSGSSTNADVGYGETSGIVCCQCVSDSAGDIECCRPGSRPSKEFEFGLFQLRTMSSHRPRPILPSEGKEVPSLRKTWTL